MITVALVFIKNGIALGLIYTVACLFHYYRLCCKNIIFETPKIKINAKNMKHLHFSKENIDITIEKHENSNKKKTKMLNESL